MIVVDLAELRGQVVLTPNMEKGLNFLLESGQKEFPVGRQVIDGDNVYAEIQAYDSIEGDPEVFEGHRQYIDIQYVAAGEETIAWTALKDATITTPYVDGDDYQLGTAPADKVTKVRLSAGQLAVLYPVDLHAPRRASGSSVPVRKIVVKVAID
jgi:YhcH/YjgK/YiaL family protein